MTENYNTNTENEVNRDEEKEESVKTFAEEKDEKLFTQQQVEKLISERIKRERKNNESLIHLRELIKKLSENGTFKGKSYGEITEGIISSFSQDKENDEKDVSEETKSEQAECVENTAQSDDNAEFVAADFGGEEKDDGISKDVGEKHTKEKTAIDLLCSFKEKYPSMDMNKIFEGGMFKTFAKGREGSVYEICEDYCAFLSEFYGEDEFSEKENERSGRISSTGFSAYSGSESEYGTLTKQQMDIAKSAGISYREYAELLSSIPKRQSKQVK